jgi:hypothetical protein
MKRSMIGLMAALALAVLAADMALIAASTSLEPCLLVRAAPPAWIC